ncbi:hypothetical protein AB0F71_31720 [Kitasatospora sp. NPDC028055]|uniref:hypothetical protein n=1 Tax=Kitasatospora sp. NPDC028055 TaxID=3155653 RepID=UPI0033CC5599
MGRTKQERLDRAKHTAASRRAALPQPRPAGADEVFQHILGLELDRATDRATDRAADGITGLGTGELACSGVPYSRLSAARLTVGDPRNLAAGC